jgi:DNA-binding transcriptional LysR family regulator
MRLRHIETFHAVMQTASLRDAAKLVNVTQSAVSRVLQHAELQLGFPLFSRQKGRLVPTNEALRLKEPIEQLFRHLEEVQRLARSLKEGGQEQPALRIAASLTLSRRVLPLAVDLFREQFAHVPLSLAAMQSHEVVGSLAVEEADIGFAFESRAHPGLEHEAVAEGEMVCIAPKGSLENRIVAQGEACLADLAHQSVIGLASRDPLGLALQRACRDQGVGLSSEIVVQTYHAALSMAEHGLGIALIDSFTATSADRTVVDVLRLGPRIPAAMTALRSRARPASVAGTAFVRCVRQAAALGV